MQIFKEIDVTGDDVDDDGGGEKEKNVSIYE